MAETDNIIPDMHNLEHLVTAIQQTNQHFLNQVQKQVNTALSVRNWIIGYYIVEYEQKGEDRAEYGERLFKNLAESLKKAGLKGLSFTALHLCKQFYLSYPQIIQAATEYLQLTGTSNIRIIQSATEQSETIGHTAADLLLNRLSFTHIVELIKAESPLKRIFYETEIIRNNWSVRALQRAMNCMLFERTGLSTDKKAVLERSRSGMELKPDDVFRDPYLLDFLGLEKKHLMLKQTWNRRL